MSKFNLSNSALILTLLLLALPARAEFYEVEMTLFTNESQRYAKEQSWPNNINVSYPDNLASLSSRPVDDIYPEMTNPNRPSANPYLVPLLDGHFSRHQEHVRNLQQSGEHRVLFSKTWLQKAERRSFAKNIIIQAGQMQANVHESAGTVSLYFTSEPNSGNPVLHFNTRLWLVTFGENTSGQAWPIPASFTVTDDGFMPMPVDSSSRIQRIALLNASEIIAPNTLHYIDHPLFGVLLEIRPYSAITLSE